MVCARQKNCFSADFMLCFSSFCCLGVRWSDTLSRDNIQYAAFWAALLFWTICSIVEINTSLTSIGLVSLVVAVYYRQKIRRSFGLEAGTCGTITLDCLSWMFCAPCAAAQEARQVEYIQPVPSAHNDER